MNSAQMIAAAEKGWLRKLDWDTFDENRYKNIFVLCGENMVEFRACKLRPTKVTGESELITPYGDRMRIYLKENRMNAYTKQGREKNDCWYLPAESLFNSPDMEENLQIVHNRGLELIDEPRPEYAVAANLNEAREKYHDIIELTFGDFLLSDKNRCKVNEYEKAKKQLLEIAANIFAEYMLYQRKWWEGLK